MSCKATLTDLVEALTQSMSVVETAKTALHIELSQIIREARKQLNLSQKELAEKNGCKTKPRIPLGKRRMQLHHRHLSGNRKCAQAFCTVSLNF